MNRQSLTGVLLIWANLIPLAGVLFLDWEILPLMALFWFENVVVGLWNLVKMATVRGIPLGARLFLMVFFTLHYGGFTFGHGLFIAMLFGPPGEVGDIPMLLEVIQDREILIALMGLAASHGASFFFNFIGAGEYRKLKLNELMRQPYGRVVVLHIALLGGGLLIQTLGEPLAGLILLVVIKIVVDYAAHRREHRQVAAIAPADAPVDGMR